MKGMDIHQQLVDLLTHGQARFRVMEHEAMGKCEAVSEIRGTHLSQGAKALVCKIKGNGIKQVVLAILGADLQADLPCSRSTWAVRRRRWQARRKWMHSPAAFLARSPRSVFTRSLNWWPIRYYLSATTKSPLMPACLRNRLSWTPPTICGSPNPHWWPFIARRLPAPLQIAHRNNQRGGSREKKRGYPERVGRE